MHIRFDPDDLTLGDLEDFEAATGKNITDVARPVPALEPDPDTGELRRKFDAEGRPVMEVRMTAKEMVALVWLLQRKADPSFTMDDARKVRVKTLEIVSGEDQDDAGRVAEAKSRGNG